MSSYDPIIEKAANTYGLDANLIRAQMHQESGGKRNAMSNKGASGLMQLMPATARELGVTDIFDPEQNIMAGAKYLKQNLDKYRRPELALAAYNAGPGAVDKYGGIPPYKETKNYVRRIMDNYAKIAGDIGNAMIKPAMADDAPAEELMQKFQAWKQSKQAAPQQAPQAEPELMAKFQAWKASKQKPAEPHQLDPINQGLRDIGGGVIAGISGIGSNILRLGDTYDDMVGKEYNRLPSHEERTNAIAGFLKDQGVNPENTLYKGGKLGAEIAGTAGAGGALAKVPQLAPIATELATGGIQGANLATRTAGGALAGAAQTAMVDPKNVLVGAAAGGALPGAIDTAAKTGIGLVNAYRSFTRPQQDKLAEKLVELTGRSKDDIIDLLTNESRVAEIPGLIKTAPQILQDPNISQLARTVKTNNSMALSEAEKAQQGAYRNALESIAPSNLTVQDAADKAGSAIGSAVKEDYRQASQAVSQKFNELRNNPEKVVQLPLDKLRATVDQYLGKGTVGKGSGAQQALRVAEDLSEVRPVQGQVPEQAAAPRTAWHKSPVNTESDNMLQAITKLGGINKEAAQSTYGNKIWEDVGQGGFNVFRNQGGKSLDEMAELLKEEGYLADHENLNDLVEYLYGDPKNMFSMGKASYGGDFAPTITEADDLHKQLGELISALNKKNAPKEAIEKAPRDLSGKVNFQELQNLRSSIGDLAQQATLQGKNTEAAALKQMVGDIDGHLDELANNWEGVTPVWLDKYKDARAAHRAKMQRFKTGPQEKLFKPKSNGEMAIEGGQIPGQFYSSKASQARDVESFKRLVNNKPELINELKQFAVTKAGQTATLNGNLGNAYVKWAATHSGANKALFTGAEKAKIDAISKSIQQAYKAENLGRVSGSDTAQKLKSVLDLGLIDNRLVNMAASKLPMGNAFLSALKESTGRERSNMLADLLANPDLLKTTLKNTKPLTRAAHDTNNALSRALARSVPVIAAGRQ